MIHRIYRLTQAKKIEIFQRELSFNNQNIIVAPTYLSICAADLRYYYGRRNKEMMGKKLPMALIHEGVARVCYDPTGNFSSGQNVVLIPNVAGAEDNSIKDNYRTDSRFLSSGEDGFLQDLMSIDRRQVLPINAHEKDLHVYTMVELLSVTFNAISSLPRQPRGPICIFGNGNVGFTCALIIKYIYPHLPLYVIGTNQHKLQYFAFADKTHNFSELPTDLDFDVAFECVGGEESATVIDTIIKHIKAQGIIALLGVSEAKTPINTRTILEKGLTLFGCSRSDNKDFISALKLIETYPDIVARLRTIVSRITEVATLEQLHSSFEQAQTADFKTVIKWNV